MGAAAVALVVAIVAGLVYGGRLKARHTAGAPGAQTTVAVSNVNFKCTLPLVVDGTPAFLTFPDGKLTIAKTTEKDRDMMFDYKAGRWLPKSMPMRPGRGAPSASIAISPDGQSYAYLVETPEFTGIADMYVRELATGRDRIVYRGLGRNSELLWPGPILGWSSSGIYVTTVAEYGANPDVYLVDPSSKAAPRRVGPNPAIPPYRFSPAAQFSSPTADFTSIDGGYAWGYFYGYLKSDDQRTLVGRHVDRILRMDLRNGLVDTWYSNAAPVWISIVGFDPQGHPFLSLRNTSGELNLLRGLNELVRIPSPSFTTGVFFGDPRGVWSGGNGSLWLYTSDRGLGQVATFPKGFFPTPPPTQKMIDLGLPDLTPYPNYVLPAGPCR